MMFAARRCGSVLAVKQVDDNDHSHSEMVGGWIPMPKLSAPVSRRQWRLIHLRASAGRIFRVAPAESLI